MKLSKIISLLLVPLLLFTLALPAYADGGSESYLIYFETGGGTGVPIIASTNLDGKLTSLPSPVMDGYTFEGWYTDELDGDLGSQLRRKRRRVICIDGISEIQLHYI